MGKEALGVSAAGGWVARVDLLGRRDDLLHRVAQRTDSGGDELRERAASRPEDRRTREEGFHGHETERLVPLRRVPQAPGACEQRRFRRAVHFTDELDRSRKAGPPAAGDDQSVTGVLGGFYGPVIALSAVQLAEEEVVLRRALRETSEDVVGGIEPVVHEDLAVVTARVVS